MAKIFREVEDLPDNAANSNLPQAGPMHSDSPYALKVDMEGMGKRMDMLERGVRGIYAKFKEMDGQAPAVPAQGAPMGEAAPTKAMESADDDADEKKVKESADADADDVKGDKDIKEKKKEELKDDEKVEEKKKEELKDEESKEATGGQGLGLIQQGKAATESLKKLSQRQSVVSTPGKTNTDMKSIVKEYLKKR